MGVKGFSGENGRVTKMHAVRTERTSEGKTVPIEGSDHEIDCDLVLLAIGFTGPVRDRFLEEMDLGYTDRGAIASQDGFGTDDPKFFVAGDAKRGLPDRVGHHGGAQGRPPGRRVPDGREPAPGG